MLRKFNSSKIITEEEFFKLSFPALPDGFESWDQERKEDYLSCILYTVVEELDFNVCFDPETAFETVKNLPIA